jgi:hypothetical protein
MWKVLEFDVYFTQAAILRCLSVDINKVKVKVKFTLEQATKAQRR